MNNSNRETINILRQAVQLLEGSIGQPNGATNAQANTPTNVSQPTVSNTLQPTVSNTLQPSTSSSRTNQIVVEEHRRLFSRQSRIQPYSRRIQSLRRRAPKKEKSYTRTMFCFSDKTATEAPSGSIKIELHRNGLGEKRVSFPASATSSTVKDLICQAYPQLCNTGGFQLLISEEKSKKQLKVVSHGSCTTEQMRCFGTGRIYIRPLQRSISAENVGLQEEYEDCIACGSSFAVSKMRQHQEACEGYNSSGDDCDDDEELPLGLHIERPNENVVLGNDEVLVENNEDSGASSSQINIEDETETAAAENAASSNERVHPNLVDEVIIYNYEDHLQKAIDATVEATSVDEEPVRLLRTFVYHFLRGRPLDLLNPNETIEGDTAEIFVSRFNIFEDGMDELLSGYGYDPSLPLEITFTGERAQDLGGPRKEFLGAMMREIKDRLFVENKDNSLTYDLHHDIVSESRRYYYGAGLIFGYSMLQGGPLPCFMSKDLIEKLFADPTTVVLSNDKQQLREGLSRFGLVKLINKRRSMMYLLRPTAFSPLTYARMVRLLNPTFSEPGSNKRTQEDRTYRLFLNYLKDVAAGRRERITLGTILRFSTCVENEPVLGFAIHPSLMFSDSMTSCFPTSNTCINTLILPIGEVVPGGSPEQVYSKFDLAFANNYFGLV